jgi:hypothetical protein
LTDSSGERHASGMLLSAYEFDSSDASRQMHAPYERDRAATLAQLGAIVDQAIVSVDVGELDLRLSITFANALQLTVPCASAATEVAEPADAPDCEPMACWELYLPDTIRPMIEGIRAIPSWPLVKVLPTGRWVARTWGGP